MMKKWLLLCFLPLLLMSCNKTEDNENILTGIYTSVVNGTYSDIVQVEGGYYAVDWLDTQLTWEVSTGNAEPTVYFDLVHLNEQGEVVDTISLTDTLIEVKSPSLVCEEGVFIRQNDEIWHFDWDGKQEICYTFDTTPDSLALEKTDDGFVLVAGKEVAFLHDDFTEIERWEFSESYKPSEINWLGVEEDWIWYVRQQTKDKKTGYVLEKWQHGELVETWELHETIINNFLMQHVKVAGCEDGWLYCYYPNSGVYRWQYTDIEGEIETVMDFSMSGINGKKVRNVCKMTKKDQYLVAIYEDKDEYNPFTGYKKTTQYMVSAPDRNLEDMTVLNLVCLGADADTMDAILKFNNSHEDAYIKLVDYSQYGGSYFGEEPMNLDLSTGVVHADILINSSIIPLMDLYSLMTGTVQPDDIAQCVKNSYEVDGKLYQIGTNITFGSRIGKRENFEGVTGWNLEQFLDYVDSLGEDEYMMEYISQDTAEELLGSNVYTAFNTKTEANFDSNLYIRLLNYIATLPTVPDEIMEHGVDNREQLAAGDFEGEFQLQYEAAGENLYQNGKLKLYNNEYGSGDNFYNLTYLLEYCEDFHTTDIALPGYPVPEGNGVSVSYYGSKYAIPQSCTNPTLAWEFIESILIDSMELPPDDSYAYEALNYKFTTLTKPFEKYMEKLQGCQVRFSEKGMWKGFDLEMLENSHIESLDDYIFPLIRNLYETAGYQGSVTRDVRNIIREEQSRFLSGAVTAEVCADATQSRVQLYLDENN